MKHRVNQMLMALAAVFPVCAMAAGNEELDALRADVRKLQVKLDALEDEKAESGLAGFKISGMMDPTYIASRNRRSAGFNFLNNFDGVDRSPAGQDSVYAFDNSFFGQLLLQVEKETEGGTQWKLALTPHKSGSSTFNLGSIIHEASVSVPIDDTPVRVLAGQFPDFTGYEYFLSHETKLVTHNLLFDFTQPSYYAGAGIEHKSDSWTTRALIANMNKSSQSDDERSPVLVFRSDYSDSEYSGFGVTGQFGKYLDQRLAMLSTDTWFIRGPLTVYGQVNVGAWKNMAFNGGNARWAGASALGAYKVTPQLELIARLDYLKNDKNGGGTIATVFTGCSDADGVGIGCADPLVADPGAGDYRNGFGPSVDALTAALANGTPGQVRGANRTALSLGTNYSINASTLLKMEVRYDRSSQPTFLDQKTGDYRKSNTLFATSLVVTF